MPSYFLMILLFTALSSNLHANKFTVSIAVIGDHLSGKTALLRRYCENEYRPQEVTLVGFDLHFVKREIGAHTVSIKMLEWPGIRRFINIFLPTLSKAEGIIYVYDSTDRDSITGLKSISRIVDASLGTRKLPTVLIGTKTDSFDKTVSTDEGDKLAQEMDARVFETSARTADGVNEAFDSLLTQIIKMKEKEVRFQESENLGAEFRQESLSTKSVKNHSNYDRSSAPLRKVQPTMSYEFFDGNFSIN